MTDDNGYDDTQDDNSDDDSNEGGKVTLPRKNLRTLERDAKDARQAREQLAQMTRENTLYKSGLGTLTERQQKALFASIDGDVTAESARAAAEELGFVQPAADSANDVERRQMEQMSQASAGASDPNSEDAIARLDRAEAEGGYDGILAELRANGALRT